MKICENYKNRDYEARNFLYVMYKARVQVNPEQMMKWCLLRGRLFYSFWLC